MRQSSSSIIVSSTVQGAAKAKSYSRSRRAAYWDCTTEAAMRLSRQTKAATDCYTWGGGGLSARYKATMT